MREEGRGNREQGRRKWLRGPALLLALLAACVDVPAESPGVAVEAVEAVEAVDDAGRTVRLPRPARRVVSLLPAGTETLFALGAGDRVVGRTRFDTDDRLAHLPSVGGGLDPSLEALVSLRPDLVVAFETAGGSPIRRRLESLGIPVFAIQAQDTSDIYGNIARLGRLVGRRAAADSLLASVRARLAAVRASAGGGPRPRVVYVAGVDPPIVAAEGTYLWELVGVAGGEPVAVVEGGAPLWPQVSLEALVLADPDVLVLPVGADPTASVERLRREPGWRDLRAVREGRVAVVDADLMNRPGPHIGEAAERLRSALAAAGEVR